MSMNSICLPQKADSWVREGDLEQAMLNIMQRGSEDKAKKYLEEVVQWNPKGAIMASYGSLGYDANGYPADMTSAFDPKYRGIRAMDKLE